MAQRWAVPILENESYTDFCQLPVRLPEGADTWAALPKAVAREVKYNPGGVFRADRQRNNCLRLTYSHNTPAEIREGIARLAELFQQEGYFGG